MLPLKQVWAKSTFSVGGGQAEWQAFRARFVEADGRIVDTGNGGVSHSEGQGMGLLFAQHFDDPATFETIATWTRTTLQTAGTALHAWRFVPGKTSDSTGIVADRNNATDGDILIASALARAARKWDRPDYRAAASAIAQDILDNLVRQVGGRTVLLPGMEGFSSRRITIVNPSYYNFAGLADLEAVLPSPAWRRVAEGGRRILSEGRFGRWRLPPDWLAVSNADGSLGVAPGHPLRFSYDAIRIPLHVAWARLPLPEVMQSIAAFWASDARHVAWIDLESGETASYEANEGMMAIRQFASTDPAATADSAGFAPVASAADYYSASLLLLTQVARGASVRALPPVPAACRDAA